MVWPHDLTAVISRPLAGRPASQHRRRQTALQHAASRELFPTNPGFFEARSGKVPQMADAAKPGFAVAALQKKAIL